MGNMKRNRRVGLIRQIVVGVIGLVMIFAVAVQPTAAYNESDSLTFEFNGVVLQPFAMLNLFEKKTSGTKTTKGIQGASFQLYKGTGTDEPIGGTYTTDVNGQIVTEELEFGDYHFTETMPASSWDFDVSGDDEVVDYPFSVTKADGAKGVVVVTAYNVSTTTDPSTPAPEASRLPVTGYNGTTYVVGDDGNVISWGDNSVGQLGREGSGSTAARMVFPGKEKISQVVCGYDNGKTMYAITTDGYVYSWGKDVDGTLGTGATNGTKQGLPKKVQKESGGDLDKVISLSLGYQKGHTMFAITRGGRVYAWGYEDGKGMLGTGDNSPISKAKVVINETTSALDSVEHLVAGYGTDNSQTMIAVSDDSHGIYAWGENGYNQLAVGDTMNDVWRNRKAIALDATGDGGTWKGDGSAWQLDVEVPIGLAFSADPKGNISLPSELSIKNYSTQPVKLVEADYTEGEWKLVSGTPNQAFNSKEFKIGTSFGDSNDLLSVVKKELPNEVVWGKKWSKQGNASIDLALSASSKIAPQTEIRTQRGAGSISLLLAWF